MVYLGLGYECIVVGFDGSPASKHAVIRSIDIASRFAANVYVVTVVPVPWMALGEMLSPLVPDLNELMTNAREGLEKLVHEVKEVTGYTKIEPIIAEGEPAETLIKLARERGCDLIVVGRRGASRLEYLLVGSVSSRVISLAKDIDVLIVH